jgi:hypothetical protein
MDTPYSCYHFGQYYRGGVNHQRHGPNEQTVHHALLQRNHNAYLNQLVNNWVLAHDHVTVITVEATRI